MKTTINLKEFFLKPRNLMILTCASIILSGWFIFPITSSFVFEGGQNIILLVAGSLICYSFILYIAASNFYILFHQKYVKVLLISLLSNLGSIGLHIMTEWGQVTLTETLVLRHLAPHVIVVPIYVTLCYGLISWRRNKAFNLSASKENI